MKLLVWLAACAAALCLAAPAPFALAEPAPANGAYRNFRVAVYVTVTDTRRLADPAEFDREFARAMGQVKFDKVYVEAYRDGVFATDDEIERVKHAFEARGVQVDGGITLAKSNPGGQFTTFDYENPADRAECERAVRLAARHFDHIILDDFFFYNTKSDADIAAKGARSWTQYRLERMREVARDLVLGPAKAVNPRATVTIKYPNWYEHFQGLGFDLDKEAHMFDSIYTGTETRDSEITDQQLQPYESYEIIRYFDHIRPGANGGGWVDTYDVRYVDRYAEQLWDTLFAKAPEITLFNWSSTSDPRAVKPGDRAAWANLPTSFDWNAFVRAYRPTGPSDQGPGWGAVAGYSFRQVDKVLGALGDPTGIWSYRPNQSSSAEDFLPNYLGTVGIPIELTPDFPAQAQTLLLTQAAATDPNIVEEIKGQLRAGKSVFITSGLLKALQGRGIEDIVEIYPTGRVVSVHDFYGGHGAGAGRYLNDPARQTPSVLVPELHFFTNDAWPVIRGVASSKGFPILLMNRYSNGIVYVLDIPENIGDLYNLPQGVITQIKSYLQQDFPVRIDAPAGVALFAYDNGTFVVESYRPTVSDVGISVAGENVRLRDISSGEMLATTTAGEGAVAGERPSEIERRRMTEPPRTLIRTSVEPHSYGVFQVVR